MAWLLPGLTQAAAGALLLTMGVILIIGAVWGFRSLVVSLRKVRAVEPEEPSPKMARRFSSKGRNIIVVTTFLMVSLYVLANVLLMSGGWSGSGGPSHGDKIYLSSEYLGGPYNASIENWQYYNGEFWSDFYKIVFTEDGQRKEGSFDPSLRPALDWIKSNTSANSTILSWWDYGLMIKGYTGRNSVIYYPSKNLLDTVADKSSVKQFEPEEKVKKVAETLLAKDGPDIESGMQQLGATHILTVSRDSSAIAWAILKGAGLDPNEYLEEEGGRQLPNAKSGDMFIFKVWSTGEFNGTKVDYKDIVSQVREPA
jgi:hypothetical protein